MEDVFLCMSDDQSLLLERMVSRRCCERKKLLDQERAKFMINMKDRSLLVSFVRSESEDDGKGVESIEVNMPQVILILLMMTVMITV